MDENKAMNILQQIKEENNRKAEVVSANMSNMDVRWTENDVKVMNNIFYKCALENRAIDVVLNTLLNKSYIDVNALVGTLDEKETISYVEHILEQHANGTPSIYTNKENNAFKSMMNIIINKQKRIDELELLMKMASNDNQSGKRIYNYATDENIKLKGIIKLMADDLVDYWADVEKAYSDSVTDNVPKTVEGITKFYEEQYRREKGEIKDE